jgi:type IV secretory pathway TraG/TraD family ATPase VirD4
MKVLDTFKHTKIFFQKESHNLFTGLCTGLNCMILSLSLQKIKVVNLQEMNYDKNHLFL